MRWFLGAALLLAAHPAWAQDERPTGYPRSANEGTTEPVSVSIVYAADIRSDVDGGIRRGTRYLDNLDLQLALDANKLIGWHGARMFAYAIYNNGTAFSSDVVGDVQSVSNVETDVRAFRLFEAWIEQDVGRNASIKVGLYNLNSEFDTTQSGGFFLLSSHGIGPDFSQSGRNGPSIFPVTSLAVRAEGKLGKNWLARVAVLDGVPGDPAHPAATAIKLSARDGALVVGEVDYLKGGTKAAIGAWGYSARFDTIPLPGTTPSGRGNKGAYIFAEHRLKGTRADDADGLAGWLRLGVADTRYNSIASYLGGGIVYAGPFKGRKDDQIGLSFASANFSQRYRRSQTLRGTPIDRREVVIEAGYLAALASWLRVQPDIQYVINPGGDARRGDAVVAGFRVKIGR
jgi:porin